MNAAEFHAGRRFADTRFGRIAYYERGSGPAALFVHGLPLSGYEWRDVVAALAGERRCLVPDLLGLGHSEVAPGQAPTFGEQAAMLVAFLDAVGADRVDLVGNDTGGGISQIVAATASERVRTLTLTNCEVHDLWPNALLEGFYAGVAAGAVPEGMKAMLGDLALARAQLGALVYEDARTFTAEAVEVYLAPVVASEARVRLLQALCDWKANRADLVAVAPRLGRSKVPAQVLWGDGDVVFDTKPSLEWLRANLGGLETVTIVPGGKLFWPEERPRLASELVGAFWRRAGA